MTLLAYLLKVIVVSAIFYGYYRLFLRNKRFHHYNRFFLLSALLLSIVLPFIRIPLLYQPENLVNDAVYRTVSVINVYDGDDISAIGPVVPIDEPVFTLMNSIYLLYAIGVLFLMTLVVKSLLYISSLKKRYPSENITNLRFYNTREPGTPFSFFRSVFWSDQLPFNSREGQQIFRHELFHVQHQHSVDRLFSEVLTAVFWFNPFFHLLKKELKAIHEFLADQFAISGSDRYTYAALLVQQALESGKHAVTNHFFQNHIKRRIAMITQFQQSKYGYWSRVMILPVSLLLFCFVTLYAKKPAVAAEKKPAEIAIEKPVMLLADKENEKLKFKTGNERTIYKKANAASADTIPAKNEKERELLKIRKEQLELLKRNMQEQEEAMKILQRVELEQLKKQMMEQELMMREKEENMKMKMEAELEFKKEMLDRKQRMNREVEEQQEKMKEILKEHEMRAKEDPAYRKELEAKQEHIKKEMEAMQRELKSKEVEQVEIMKQRMREIEMKSMEHEKEFRNRQENFLNLKQELKEKELILKKRQQEELQRFREELKRHEEELREKERELQRRKEKENREQELSYRLAPDNLSQDNAFLVHNTSFLQDTIPAKRANGAKPAKPAKPSEPRDRDTRKPRPERDDYKEERERDRNEHKLERVQERRKSIDEKHEMAARTKAIRAKEPRKPIEKVEKLRKLKPTKPEKKDGSGKIPDEGNEENYSDISVSGDK